MGEDEEAVVVSCILEKGQNWASAAMQSQHFLELGTDPGELMYGPHLCATPGLQRGSTSDGFLFFRLTWILRPLHLLFTLLGCLFSFRSLPLDFTSQSNGVGVGVISG